MPGKRLSNLAPKLTHDAYKTALARTGAVVVKTSAGQIVERRSDGTSKLLKRVSMGKRVKPGTVLKRVK